MSRTWRVGDLIAERDGDTWHLGTVAAVDGWLLSIRFQGGQRVTFRNRSSPCLADPDQVPIDDRHWLPPKVRDQLVRQEAAGRLRVMAGHLPHSGGLEALADRIDVGDTACFDPWLADAARALLAPAPQPDIEPTSCGGHGGGDTCRLCLDAHLDDDPVPQPATTETAR